jgi:hypothetical protein
MQHDEVDDAAAAEGCHYGAALSYAPDMPATVAIENSGLCSGGTYSRGTSGSGREAKGTTTVGLSASYF